MNIIHSNKHFKRLVKKNTFTVTFTKKTTGEVRVLKGTTDIDYIIENSDWRPTLAPAKPEKISNNITVWDLEKKAWRAVDVTTITELVIDNKREDIVVGTIPASAD